MPLKLPELLCPAGDENALRAAIDYGANAVYLGYKAFGARASAVNFDDEALQRAVCYAHLHHARVHVTVNTLVKPGELEGVHEALTAIDAAGADAVIVQDLGVAEMVRRDFPRLHLHASIEVNILFGQIPDMDAVGIQPTAVDFHTPDETLLIDQVQPFWDLLLAVLARKDTRS